MMKKSNFRIILVAILILIVGSAAGASSVSALSAEGENALGNLVASNPFADIDININRTTTATPGYSEGAEADLLAFLKEINFDYDEFRIIDLTDYVINRNGTFEKWIQYNYGTDVHVPASVKLMSPSDLVIFLMSNKMNPEYEVSTTNRYVFDDSEESTTGTAHEENSGSSDESIEHEDMTEDASGMEDMLNSHKGDVNFDDFVTAGDARLALRASARLITLDSKQYYVADVTDDGFVTAKDARIILRYSAKLITHF